VKVKLIHVVIITCLLAGMSLVINSDKVTAQLYEKRASIDSSNIAHILTTESSVPFLNKSRSVTILSHNSYTDSVGYFHVVGKVENNTPKPAQLVQVTGAFYDINNALVGSQFTHTNPSDISSGAMAPFDLILKSASVPASLIDHYKLDVTYQ
jgi:hypothetical protein